MPVRIQLPRLGNFQPTLKNVGLIVLATIAAVLLIGTLAFWVVYSRYARLTDAKLKAGPFPNSSIVYAAPETLGVGDRGSALAIAASLREAGYGQDARANRNGWYHLRQDAIEIFPGPDSYFENEGGVIRFNGERISAIISLRDNSPRTEYELEPRVLSNLFDKNREKRRLVKFADIPPVLVQAVISVEDKHFFQHSGFDPARIVKALLVDLREMRNVQGASTLTQQLARNLWLTARKTYARKLAEMMITIHLERKLSKQQIFEYYANQVDLGRRGSFTIRGFGEAAQAYFGKDIRQLTLDEAATLAGIVQQPSWRNPVRWPERARARRNVVLGYMLDNGYITKSQYETASAAPMVTSRQSGESSDAPFFVDLVNEQLLDQFQDRDLSGSGYRIYTTLDRDLQQAAVQAIASGMQEVDARLRKRLKRSETFEEPQVALICLDPHTGEVKALSGGRNYAASQLDHAVAKRPSGSVFKPFVYAAALNTALSGAHPVVTTASVLEDEPKTFTFGGVDYEPNNFHKAWHGSVTLRDALVKSLNVPTVEIAEQVGYNNVVRLAEQAGLNHEIKPTPAMALGAYDVTPLEMAGAYTVFANKGTYMRAEMIDRIRDRDGEDVFVAKPQGRRVLDPRINFIMVSLMQDVLRSGTGAGVRSRGFVLPAAGKTGTSHDAWFAGFTSKLLCVVWVGLDDYKDLKFEGAKDALPVWTDFMKRAHKLRDYRDVSDFEVPDGLVNLQIDPQTGQLATGACPQVRSEFFVAGTQPVTFCALHSGDAVQVANWSLPGVGGQSASPPAFTPARGVTPGTQPGGFPPATLPNNYPQPLPPSTTDPNANPNDAGNRPAEKEKKRGFFDRLKGIFR